MHAQNVQQLRQYLTLLFQFTQCFTVTCYSTIFWFNISLTSCFYSRFTQIIQKIYRGSFQYFVANPWALMTCLTLLGIDSIRVWTISIGNFPHSSRIKACKSERVFGGGHLLLIAFFRTIHKFSIGLRSGLCTGHSKDSRQWLFFQDVTTLARWTGALSSCKIVALPPCCLSATSSKKCFCKMRRYFAQVALPLTMASGPTPT